MEENAVTGSYGAAALLAKKIGINSRRVATDSVVHATQDSGCVKLHHQKE